VNQTGGEKKERKENH